jgi:hypothetical protein
VEQLADLDSQLVRQIESDAYDHRTLDTRLVKPVRIGSARLADSGVAALPLLERLLSRQGLVGFDSELGLG